MNVFLKKTTVQQYFLGILTLILIVSGTVGCSNDRKKDPLTPEERSWVLKHDGKIRISGAPDWPPISFTKEGARGEKQLKGMSFDFIELIEIKLRVKFLRVHAKTWPELLAMTQQGKIDVISSIQKTSERSRFLNFTTPHINLSNVIIVRKNVREFFNLNDLKGKKIAVGKDFSVTEYIEEKYPDLELDKENHDDYSIIKKVAFGEVYAGISDLATVSHWVDEKAITNLRVAGEVDYKMELSMASRKDLPILNRILEKGAGLITPKERKEIWNEWVTINSSHLPIWFWYLIGVIFTILLIALVALIWSHILRRILKKMVAERTESLNKALNDSIIAEKKYRDIFDRAVEGFFQTRLDGGLINVNPAFASIMGYDSVDDVIKHVQNVKDLYRDEAKRDELIEKIKTTGQVKDFEVSGYRKDRTETCVLINAQIVKERGLEPYLEGTLVDITSKKEKERLKIENEAIKRANHSKSLFMANMSHDIRTPMNAILGFSRELKDMLPDQKLKRKLDKIMTSGNFLIDLIDDILDLIKDDIDDLKLKSHPTQVHHTLKEIYDMFSGKCRRNNIDLKLEIDPTIPEFLVIDKKRFKRVIMNLVGNAVKYTDSGFIKLGVYNCDRGKKSCSSVDLRIEVKDTGIGIDPEQKDKIFNLFHQGETYDNTKYGGVGIGLHVVKRLVNKMGGKVSLESKKGEGSTFYVDFKEIQVCERHSIDKAQVFDVSAVEFKGSTILHVEDDENNRRVINGSLKSYQLVIEEAVNGEEAELYLRSHKPDLILLDLKMPKLNGCELIERIKKVEHLMDIPVVVISAHAAEDDEKNVVEAGCVGFLKKPINKEELVEILTKHLPHTIIQKVDAHGLEQVWEPTPDIIERLPELTDILENDYFKKWEKIEKRWVMGKASAFSGEISELGNRFECNPLSKWAEGVIEMMDENDYRGTIDYFSQFPQQIELLKSLIIKENLQPGSNEK